MGRRAAAWKTAVLCGAASLLPDIDVFIDHGDAVQNMVAHRGATHSLLWLSLAAPPLAWIAHRVSGPPDAFRRWWLALWLALISHALVDTLSVYGTQLAHPFSDYPYATGSLFIIDPLFPLPLVAGVVLALVVRSPAGLRANAWGLALSTAYIGWGMLAQGHVEGLVQAQLAAQGRTAHRVVVAPPGANTWQWRVVVLREGGYDEGFVSLLDGERPIRFTHGTTDPALEDALRGIDAVQRVARFSKGFYKVHAVDGYAHVTDIRMGKEPDYVFTFQVARRDGERWMPVTPRKEGGQPDPFEAIRPRHP